MLCKRRHFVLGTVSSFIFKPTGPACADEASDSFDELVFPPLGALNTPDTYGYRKPTQDEVERVNKIISETPRGPRPIDVAQSFIDRFYNDQPQLISQWPTPSSWNPLIVHFFNDATKYKVSNDMVDWCAAFANWCIFWAGKHGTGDASSQSFLRPPFKRTNEPERGDLAVFTCYTTEGASLGLGHVAFVKEKLIDPSEVTLIGGNTSKDGHSSVICEKSFQTGSKLGRRHVNGRLVPCLVRLNAYVRAG